MQEPVEHPPTDSADAERELQLHEKMGADYLESFHADRAYELALEL